jgi:pimeloyl-ACP methyl ester carboxylesterase
LATPSGDSPANHGELRTADGVRRAFCHLPGKFPAVVFLCGFRSDMSGAKATYLEQVCAARGQEYLRLDYQGHGVSSGRFEDGTIGQWVEDALAVIQAVVRGPMVLVGSSMGAWIMLVAARRLGTPVHGLVGVASAPDFTEDLRPARFTAQQREALHRDGRLSLPSDYSDEPSVITARLLEEGREHLQLRAPIPLRCPVRLIHGTADEDVPFEVSMRLMHQLESEDVRLTLVKDGDHRLSGPVELDLLGRTVSDLLDTL